MRIATRLITDAPSVVTRLFPDYRALYERRGWTMFDTIDRVYDASKAALAYSGFTCRTDFREILAATVGGNYPDSAGVCSA